uniref:Uncharacterized protein n=1 Tax=Sporolithon durum TaxID=48970 RepID=A0A141SD10_9FLOR|nr:hypothetical protein Sdur_132 [Sporolithon durum]AMK96178.1 hypothetical protein Sdur_132 [Sporolithon durum]
MEIINLTQKYLFTYQNKYISTSFALKFSKLSEIWLFNCYEGCQHILAKKNIKISHITKIIITELNIRAISGLLGLLSTFSLNSRMKQLEIYGPEGLVLYILSGRKYSQTSFRYILSVYVITNSLIIKNKKSGFSSYFDIFASSRFNYTFVALEEPGKFDIYQAIHHRIPIGVLYSRLKQCEDFILPDGYVVSGLYFINCHFIGNKMTILNNQVDRKNYEISHNSFIILYN